MIRLRKIAKKDKKTVLKIHRSAIRTGCKGFYGPAQIRAWISRFTPGVFDEGLENGENRGWAAEVSKKAAGFGILNLRSKEIKGLYILPGYAGKGLGTRLLARLEKTALKNRLSELRLNASLNAVSFYLQAGYRRIRTIKHRLKGCPPLRCVRMAKRLGARQDVRSRKRKKRV